MSGAAIDLIKKDNKKKHRKKELKADDVEKALRDNEEATSSGATKIDEEKPKPKVHSIVIIMADGFSETDYGTLREAMELADIQVLTCGMKPNIQSRFGGSYLADYLFCDASQKIDSSSALVVLGGKQGMEEACKESDFLKVLQHSVSNSKVVATSGFGVTLFLHLNVGKRVLAGDCSLEHLLVARGHSFSHDRVRTDLEIVTASGVSSSVDFAVEIVYLVAGELKTFEVKKKLEL